MSRMAWGELLSLAEVGRVHTLQSREYHQMLVTTAEAEIRAAERRRIVDWLRDRADQYAHPHGAILRANAFEIEKENRS